MTRKRFIKLCMANGMQRNAANEQAKRVGMYGSYEVMYQKIEGHCIDCVRKQISNDF